MRIHEQIMKKTAKNAETFRKERQVILSLRSLRLAFFALFAVNFFSCSGPTKTRVDLIVHHGVIYTVDSLMTTSEAFAVKDGKIVEVGQNDSIFKKYESTDTLDASGHAIYPGFIDSHCHFYNYGLGLNKVDLVGTKSFDEVIQKVIEYSKANPNAKWIIGRGWDQNDWEKKEFPNRKKLDSLFPNTPVILKRIDGHAALTNAEALRKAGIEVRKSITGGELILYEHFGSTIKNDAFENLTGILIDNAVDLVEKVIPEPTQEEVIAALMNAQKNCFEVGLTTVDDAGLMKNVIDVMDNLQKKNDLKMRVYAMLSDSAPNYEYYLKNGPYKTDRLNVRSFKFYGDGALGSRGACLLRPYSDKPGWQGFLLKDPEYFKKQAMLLADKGFQMNTHCIGDSADSYFALLYRTVITWTLKDKLKDPLQLRWRIEHAQVVDKNGFGDFRFVIPSVQPTHATSDMPWAGQRLGKERVKYAYAYKELLKASGRVALGTDFPVEDISPFKTFFAAVYRTDADGNPNGGFQVENALTKEETLKGMTIWGAFANFEEKEKGSLEKGKFADFVILDSDIMTCSPGKVLSTRVLYTYVNGEKVYEIK
jgi:predicted amidohydrolase YtcJ